MKEREREVREREEINNGDEASHPIRISGNNSDKTAHREEPCLNALVVTGIKGRSGPSQSWR